MKDWKRAQQIEQEASGKLIEENHNGRQYSVPFLDRAISHFLSLMFMRYTLRDPERYIRFFQVSCKRQLQTLLLHWNYKKGKTWEYYFFMRILEDYYENGGTGIWYICDKKFKECGIV
jgi:hypothetical protein